ncbi:protein kinase [Streptomyces sp. N35]|uniref:serine/threonine-protein kinase n=1 Tax=Streptomyces sp. N35 TaxID=2795730 RepID=UPI0018F56663|nr:serine/threonine-protein kinase [Streptomyces sp. N35]
MTHTVLSGRYRLVERLGAGGMGVVWRAEDLVLHREVAVKTVAGPGVTEQAAARLEREARAAAGLSDNQHVVTVHDFGRDGDTLFIVMALAPGRALDRVLTTEGPPAPARALDWARQICFALEAAHAAGIVHRDIKPANAVLGPDGTVRVLDFGIAWFHRDLGLDRLSQAGGVLGSVPWMSPEQARGEEVTAASDLYSLGCLLYQLLTGETPFGDREVLAQIVAHASEVPLPPSARRAGLPAELDRLVSALLAKSPDDRPGSAAETAARLGAIARELGAQETTERSPAPAAPATLPSAAEPGRQMSRRTVLFGAVGVVAVSTATIVVVPKVLEKGGDQGGGPSGAEKGGGKGDVKYRWRTPTTYTPDAIAGSALLVSDSETELVAYDVRTGKELWRGTDDIDGTYPMTKDTLYVTADHGELRCLEPESGDKRWGFAPLEDNDVSGGVFLELAPETVYVGLGPYVFSLHHATGEVRWQYPLESDMALVSGLESADRTLLVRDEGGLWIALDTVAGEEQWVWPYEKSTRPGAGPSFAGAVDGRLFFSGDSGLTVVDAADGNVIETYKGLGRVQVVPEHKLLLDTENAWSCVDGKKLWSVAEGHPFAHGDIVLANQWDPKTRTNTLLGLDPRDGTERWRHKGLFLSRSSQRGRTAPPDAPLIAKVNGQGARLVRIDPASGDKGPVLTLPEKHLLEIYCLGDLVFAVCADRGLDREGDPPDKRRLYAIELAQFGRT